MEKSRLRVGVIGAGAISDIYLQNMTGPFSDRLEVVRIAANHLEHAQKKAAKYGLTACTTEELLASPDVDLAVILTPVGTHAGLIRRALMAGKHVYTEKTLTDNLVEAASLVRLADEKGLYLASAPDTFLGSVLQTARKALDDGLLGEVHSFVISANRNNGILLSLFSFLRQPGAGILYDYGVYYLTALVSLLGPIAQVGGVIGKPYPTHVNVLPQSPDFGKTMDTPNESQVSAVVRLRSGVTGTFHIDADCNMRDEAYFAIYGTRGILYLSDANQFGGSIRFLPDEMGGAPGWATELLSLTPYRENARGVGPAELADAIREKRPCRASKEMAYHVMEALTALLRCGADGAFCPILSTCQRPDPWPVRAIGAKELMSADGPEAAAPGAMPEGQPLALLRTRDAVNMDSFYRHGLGLNKADAPADPESRNGDAGGRPRTECYEIAPGQSIGLLHADKAARQEEQGEGDGAKRICIEVEDAQAAWNAVTANGLTPDAPIRLTPDGAWRFTLTDPDGNRVELTQLPVRDAGK